MDYSRLKDANPWWEDREFIEQDIHLLKLKKQRVRWNYRLIESFDEGIYSVRGPRQVGKTTWIKQAIRDILGSDQPGNVFFYSCDDLRDFRELMEVVELFLETSDSESRRYIFLDEIPYVEEWQRGIKHLWDSGRLMNCCVVISGSHSIDINRSIERLPGRGDEGKRHFVMLPLTFLQYLRATGNDLTFKGDFDKDLAMLKINMRTARKAFREYLMTGGFLRNINELQTSGTISDSSYDVYLKWIIGDLARWGLKENFSKQMIRKIIESYSSEISWFSLRSGTEIESHHTVSRYANALEEMFALEIVYRMDYNKKVADAPRSKKIYFSDPFILSACYKWAFGSENHFSAYQEFLDSSIHKISEGVVLNHLISMLYRNTSSNIYDYKDMVFYWTNKAKTKEVDFVCNKTAFEIKYREKIKPEHYKTLQEFSNGFMISRDTFGSRTFPLPVFLLLLEQYPERFIGGFQS